MKQTKAISPIWIALRTDSLLGARTGVRMSADGSSLDKEWSQTKQQSTSGSFVAPQCLQTSGGVVSKAVNSFFSDICTTTLWTLKFHRQDTASIKVRFVSVQVFKAFSGLSKQ